MGINGCVLETLYVYIYDVFSVNCGSWIEREMVRKSSIYSLLYTPRAKSL